VCSCCKKNPQRLQDATRFTLTLSTASCHAVFWRVPTCLAEPETLLGHASIYVLVVRGDACRTRQGVSNRHVIRSDVV